MTLLLTRGDVAALLTLDDQPRGRPSMQEIW
jgi:hypothetical protein